MRWREAEPSSVAVFVSVSIRVRVAHSCSAHREALICHHPAAKVGTTGRAGVDVHIALTVDVNIDVTAFSRHASTFAASQETCRALGHVCKPDVQRCLWDYPCLHMAPTTPVAASLMRIWKLLIGCGRACAKAGHKSTASSLSIARVTAM